MCHIPSSLFSWAKIRLFLHNQGPEALDGYGPEIVIERKLSRTAKNGSSTFNVMDSALNSKGKTLKAVRKITSDFNINVANPCVVLKQSTAKQFLNSTKSTDKFKFFMQSSKLGEYESQYEEAARNVYEAREQQKNSKGSFESVKSQFLECQQQYQQLIDNQYVWILFPSLFPFSSSLSVPVMFALRFLCHCTLTLTL